MMGSGFSALYQAVGSTGASPIAKQLIVEAVVLAIITLAQRVMRSVDVTELERMKYGYKGA